MADLVRPQLGHRIADPACGSGGFLLGAYQYIVTPKGASRSREILSRSTYVGPAPVTLEQYWDIIKAQARVSEHVLRGVLEHHEKHNGKGYPRGLTGAQISTAARIIGVADVYDALTTDRAYRKGISRNIALAILHQEADEGKLDERIVLSLEGLL